MKRGLTFLILLLAITGCTEMRFFIRDDMKGVPTSKILIGDFKTRDTNYDPFISDELREALRFEFFRKGYNVQITDSNEKNGIQTEQDCAVLCSSTGSDVIITGSISRKETGAFADRSVYLSVSFLIINKNGTVTGQALYTGRDIEEPSFIKKTSESFVSGFISGTTVK